MLASLLSGAAGNRAPQSSFTEVMNTLEQLHQANPARYQVVAQQLSTRMQMSAQEAAANGNTALATRFAQLSTDFAKASAGSQIAMKR